MPREEVVNYFIWRQQDATRNSINFIARKFFSHKELMYKTTNQVQDMLFERYNINWNDFHTWIKRGFGVVKGENGWKSDEDIPIFTQDREYIEKLI